jgi:CRP-like cAMP-binding protein
MENLKRSFEENDKSILLKARKGLPLFAEGSPVGGLYLVKSGKIKLSTLNENGKEIIIELVLPGHFLGQRCFFTKRLNSMTASPIEDSELILLEKNYVIEMLQKKPHLYESFTQLLGKDLENADRRAEMLLTKNVGERLAEFLISFVHTFKKEGDDLVSEFHLSREEVASIVGTSPETVTRYFTAFKREGFLHEANRQIWIKELNKFKNVC